MKIFACYESYDYDFSYFEKLGYEIYNIPQNDFSYLEQVTSNDILFLKLDEIDDVNKIVNKDYKLIIFLFIRHEYCNENRRVSIIENKNKNHTIYFITTHLDNYTENYDLSLGARCLPFATLFSKKLPTPTILRSRNYNFFNRSANVRRLKVFELLKKDNFIFNNCYYTFGNLLKRSTFNEIYTISQFYEFRKRIYSNILELDIPYIEQFKNEFVSLEEPDGFEGENSNESTMSDILYDDVNRLSLDSYISFIIESSGDGDEDLRLTEKTVRSWFCKNIFLSLQCRGFNKALKRNGIETFEDVFGLDENWDDCSELNRINIFLNVLKKFNELSPDEVKAIYESDSVQQRLDKNYKFIMDSFNPNNAILEMQKLIGYENNVLK